MQVLRLHGGGGQKRQRGTSADTSERPASKKSTAKRDQPLAYVALVAPADAHLVRHARAVQRASHRPEASWRHGSQQVGTHARAHTHIGKTRLILINASIQDALSEEPKSTYAREVHELAKGVNDMTGYIGSFVDNLAMPDIERMINAASLERNAEWDRAVDCPACFVLAPPVTASGQGPGWSGGRSYVWQIAPLTGSEACVWHVVCSCGRRAGAF